MATPTKGSTGADLMAAPRGTITAVVGRLRALLGEHRPDTLDFHVSGQMFLETQYPANKLATALSRSDLTNRHQNRHWVSMGPGQADPGWSYLGDVEGPERGAPRLPALASPG